MGYRHTGHRRKHDPKYAQDYLDMFGSVKKWLNQCVNCQHIGRKLYTPNPSSCNDGNDYKFHAIHKYWEILELDENGLCEMCRK